MTQDGFFLACGLVSAALSICAFLPYMKAMLRGAARPLRSTWLIWSVLSAISAASNIAEGAGASLAFVAVQAGFTIMIFLLSLRYGMGSFVHHSDAGVLGAAALGLGLWWVTDAAVWALAISISVSALGGAATVLKTYRVPGSEPYSCWLIVCAASFAGVVSVGALDPVLLAYPLYLLVLYASILLAKVLGQRRATRFGAAQHEPVPLLLLQRQRADELHTARKAA